MGAVVGGRWWEGGGRPLLSAGENRLAPPVVDIRRRHVVEPLVVPAMVVEIDEGGHGRLEPPGARVDEQVQAGLERLVKALQLALGLRVMGRAVDMAESAGPPVGPKTPRHVDRA